MTLICNLVEEFNGLVSKGSVVRLALLLLYMSGRVLYAFTYNETVIRHNRPFTIHPSYE